MFKNAYYFLTLKEQDSEMVSGVEELVKILGAFPVVIDPQAHDRIVAHISHAPHGSCRSFGKYSCRQRGNR